MTLFVLHLTLLVASHGERGTGEGDCLSCVQWLTARSLITPAPAGPVVFLSHIDLGLKFRWTSVGDAAFLAVVVVVKKVAKVLLQHIMLNNGHIEWLFLEPEMSPPQPCLSESQHLS